jgi:DNA-binding response OmpR family regulator
MVTAVPTRILIIEDDQDVAFMMKVRLQFVGYDVHTETYGGPGLSYALAHRPDLVILDVRLPDLGGYEVCEELRKVYSHADLPVLMYSVLDEPGDDQRGLTSGADAYLTKRCNPEQLVDAVDTLLHETP